MFAYCCNNPTNNVDLTGYYCKVSFDAFMPFDTALVNVTGGAGGGGGFMLGAMLAGQDLSGLRINQTTSTGISVSSSWGGATGGTSICLSADRDGNYAIQESTLGGASTGLETSVTLYKTITNAKNVRDLEGESSCFGISMGNGYSISVDIVTFTLKSDPTARKWGITVAAGFGVGFEAHGADANTVTTAHWTLKDLVQLIIWGNNS